MIRYLGSVDNLDIAGVDSTTGSTEENPTAVALTASNTNIGQILTDIATMLSPDNPDFLELFPDYKVAFDSKTTRKPMVPPLLDFSKAKLNDEQLRNFNSYIANQESLPLPERIKANTSTRVNLEQTLGTSLSTLPEPFNTVPVVTTQQSVVDKLDEFTSNVQTVNADKLQSVSSSKFENFLKGIADKREDLVDLQIDQLTQLEKLATVSLPKTSTSSLPQLPSTPSPSLPAIPTPSTTIKAPTIPTPALSMENLEPLKDVQKSLNRLNLASIDRMRAMIEDIHLDRKLPSFPDLPTIPKVL